MKNNHEALYEREVLSVQLCNAFVRQYMLRSVDVERSGYWVREMERYGVRPNGQTYLIFLRAELRNGGENVRRVLEEMRKVGVGLRAVLMVLDEDEGEALKEIVREGGKGIEEYWKELREIERKESSMENTTTSAASASTSASTSEPATSTNSTSLINVMEINKEINSSFGIEYLRNALKPLEKDYKDDFLLQEAIENKSYEAYEEFEKIMNERFYKRVGIVNTKAISPILTRLSDNMIRKIHESLKEESGVVELIKGIKANRICYLILSLICRMDCYDESGRIQYAKLVFDFGRELEESQRSLFKENDKKIRAIINREKLKRDRSVNSDKLKGENLSSDSCDRSVNSGNSNSDNSGIESTSTPSTTSTTSTTSPPTTDNFERDLFVIEKELDVRWSEEQKVMIGSKFIDLMLDNCQVPMYLLDANETNRKNVKIFEFKKEYPTGVIKCHPMFINLIKKDTKFTHINASMFPMVVPSRKWVTIDEVVVLVTRGFLTLSNCTVRFIGNKFQSAEFIKKAEQVGRLKLMFNALDILGRTSWKINFKILNILIECWNRNLEIGSLPKLLNLSDFNKPKKLSEMKKIKQKLSSNHSQVCSTLYKLEIAKAFVNKTLYFPHNVDFRGRAYPIAPHLSHIGDDVCRSLLQFSTKKPLGKNGFKWLKIHISNLFGHDKCSFQDRIKFTEENSENIIRSATQPLDHTWWQSAENPFQFLAACIEYKNCIESGNVESYESAMPMQLDGSCNGLQHYAALGRDYKGAKSVNLIDGEKPMDVYSDVAKIVQEKLTLIITENESKEFKIVKQTVMTNVYGVTLIGAKEQIYSKLDFIQDEQLKYQSSLFLAKLVFESLATLFVSTRQIQTWLVQIGKEITRSIPLKDAKKYYPSIPILSLNEFHALKYSKIRPFNPSKLPLYPCTPISWTSPIGLPILQPYFSSSIIDIKTKRQSINLKILKNGMIDKRKQVTIHLTRYQVAGFPPNFVHSLDASHMFYTALECSEKGLQFAAVHDSFWTHLCDADVLAKVVREQFCRLHAESWVEELARQLRETLREHVVPVRVYGEGYKEGYKEGGNVDVEGIKGNEEGIESVEKLSEESVNSEKSLEESAINEKSKRKSTGTNYFRPVIIPDPPAKGDFDLNQSNYLIANSFKIQEASSMARKMDFLAANARVMHI
ncbi:DNA-directed RNA polymerase, phage-type domain-containing protein [Rozella allomycis CSF55]|uniref:DNA-directed RNA polymerase n=1 Tax=Rozella allomycis (strain CSF55) TaxID=988480 RepID=A0A075ARB6_ROZAC|nr:DNA-directed RNA polymerase, phage-type domain-containing protein [Rozella allomycis CSF55]|eukprot:EPZ32783.1 DNA-directed RNA polymerase, phage-type domain-containing protein [Rozella allomycis CSF55]